jgi:hypothetical protein
LCEKDTIKRYYFSDNLCLFNGENCVQYFKQNDSSLTF